MEALKTIQHDVECELELELELVAAARADHGRLLVAPDGCDGGAVGVHLRQHLNGFWRNGSRRMAARQRLQPLGTPVEGILRRFDSSHARCHDRQEVAAGPRRNLTSDIGVSESPSPEPVRRRTARHATVAECSKEPRPNAAKTGDFDV